MDPQSCSSCLGEVTWWGASAPHEEMGAKLRGFRSMKAMEPLRLEKSSVDVGSFWCVTLAVWLLDHVAKRWVLVCPRQVLGAEEPPLPLRSQPSADRSVQPAPAAPRAPGERVSPRLAGLALLGFPFICLGLGLPTWYIMVFLFQPVSV